jgi:hypothetical protein
MSDAVQQTVDDLIAQIDASDTVSPDSRGHYPSRGVWSYSVLLPKSVTARVVRNDCWGTTEKPSRYYVTFWTGDTIDDCLTGLDLDGAAAHQVFEATERRLLELRETRTLQRNAQSAPKVRALLGQLG